MTETNTLLLYVRDTKASADFYARLLGYGPVEASPGFALFLLPSGLALGLWNRQGVEPAPTAEAGASELGFKLGALGAIDEAHADWLAKGAVMALAPTDLDFGRTFVALDPDGHRLRVYAAF